MKTIDGLKWAQKSLASFSIMEGAISPFLTSLKVELIGVGSGASILAFCFFLFLFLSFIYLFICLVLAAPLSHCPRL